VCGKTWTFDTDEDTGRRRIRGETRKATAQDLIHLASLMGIEAPKDAAQHDDFAARFLASLREGRRDRNRGN